MALTQGIVINRNTQNTEKFSMDLLTVNTLDEVMRLQDFVYQGLDNKEVLARDTQNFIEKSLSDGGFIIGVFNDAQQLISYRFIGLPDADDNMGIDLRLPNEQLHRVAHLETTVVHPHYRGNGLQSKTLQVAYPLLKDAHIRHLICTVSPYNLFSLMNIMKNGLKIKVLAKKYGQLDDNSDGLWRFILHRDLEATTLKSIIQGVNVKFDKFDIQKSLLDKGFIGDALSVDGKMLSYVK